MRRISLSRRTLAEIKQTLASALDVRSTPLTEAIAAGLGFATNAALLADMKTSPHLVYDTDLDAFLNRLAELRCPVSREDAWLPWLHATHLRIFAWNNFPDDISDIVHGCRMMNDARTLIAEESALGAVMVAIFPVFADKDADRITVSEGRLSFAPEKIHSAENAKLFIETALFPYAYGRLPLPLEISKRRLQELPVPVVIGKLIKEFKEKKTMLTEATSTILAMHLAARMTEVTDHAEWNSCADDLIDIARFHSPELAYHALKAELERSSNGRWEAQAESIIGCTNSKFFMKVEDPVATMELAIKSAPSMKKLLEPQIDIEAEKTPVKQGWLSSALRSIGLKDSSARPD